VKFEEVEPGTRTTMSFNQALFFEHYEGDETWNGTDIAHELKVFKERKNDVYPQGRDNVKKLIKACEGTGLTLKIKAKKTKPYWTWYYEVEDHKKGRLCLDGMGSFLKTEEGDQTWVGTDMDHEIKNLHERKNDIYPQGKDTVEKFLKLCKEKGYTCKIKAKKTKPYWTWFYEIIA